MSRLKVLYVQVPPGGGSLIALYEMIKNIDKTLVEPVVLSYYKNDFTRMLESVSTVVYLPLAPLNKSRNTKSKTSSKIFSVILQQLLLLKEYFISSKPVRKELLCIIKQLSPSVIHHNNEIFLNRNAVRAGIKAGLPQIIHERSLGKYGHNYVNKIIDRMLMRKVAHRIDITRAVAIHFNRLYPATTTKSIVLHDIVDIEKFKPALPGSELKDSFGIIKDTVVITYIGRIIKWKGLHVLIEAIALIKNKLPDYKVLIVGPDDEGIGSSKYKASMQKIIDDLGLTENFIFTGNRNDIPAIINISDVVVHCSIKPEPQGLIIIEALLCKKPVIAVANAGSGEMINKYGGIPLQPVNAAKLAEKLEDLLIKKSITSANNFEKLINDFDAVKQTVTLMNLYNSVLAS